MKKRLIRSIVFLLVIGATLSLVTLANGIGLNDGARNLSNTMRYFASWAANFGLAAMFIGAITIGMAYRTDNPSIKQKGLIMLVIGAACTQSTTILTVVGLIE